MKTYQELTEEQRALAVEKAREEAMRDLLELGPDEMLPDDLIPLANAAWAKAEDAQTPWFIHEFLWGIKAIKDYLFTLAQDNAETAIYLEPGEFAYREPNTPKV